MVTNAWVAKAKDGFNTLEVSEKYINSALKCLETWLTDQSFSDYVSQIQYLIDRLLLNANLSNCCVGKYI